VNTGDCQTMMGMIGWMGWVGVMMLVNLLLGLGLIALVVVGVIAGIRWITRSTDGPRGSASPGRALEAARERYARGEISRGEFQRLREDLE